MTKNIKSIKNGLKSRIFITAGERSVACGNKNADWRIAANCTTFVCDYELKIGGAKIMPSRHRESKNEFFVMYCDNISVFTVLVIEEDPRIIYIDKQVNRGNYTCRNEECRLAKGKYICVMDGDDIAMFDRLEKQVEIMEANLEILVLGTDFEFINGSICRKPKEYPLLRILLLQNNMFLHLSLIIKKEVLLQVCYYNEKYCYASDYDLMCRIALIGKVINIPDTLMRYRLHEKQISSSQYIKQTFYANQIRLSYLKACGFKLSTNTEMYFTKMMTYSKLVDDDIKKIKIIVNSLKKQNKKLDLFENNLFDKFMDLILSQCYLRID